MPKPKRKSKAKSSWWLDREQRIALSNILIGYTIAGGLAVFSYIGNPSSYSLSDAAAIVLVTVICLIVTLWIRKEK
ncbi:MAG: hypothetical protein QM523_11620 [Candidatus Pacebacteria bacterium]|nr:hypothetical protein [Candidatus Paceibacterota bacterium]